MPCPISTCGIIRVTLPSWSMRMKALGANLPSVAGACSGRAGAERQSGTRARSRRPRRRAPSASVRRDELRSAWSVHGHQAPSCLAPRRA